MKYRMYFAIWSLQECQLVAMLCGTDQRDRVGFEFLIVVTPFP